MKIDKIIPLIIIIMLIVSVVAYAADSPNKCVKAGDFRSTPILMERISYAVDSGLHSGTTTSRDPVRAFQANVEVQGARWLRLHFEDFHLGRRSYMTITSRKDGEQQRFNARSLEQWHGSSAYFNGDAVEIALFVASNDDDVFFRLSEVSIEVKRVLNYDLNSVKKSLPCQGQDYRELTDPYDYAVGRIVENSQSIYSGCTGFLISNNSFISAGHCNLSQGEIIQFNVPLSESDGTINHPPVQDQYAIASIYNQGIGGNDDWVVFDVAANSNSGLRPVQAYGEFYRIRDGVSDSLWLQVIGFGGAKKEDEESYTQRLSPDGFNYGYSFNGEIVDHGAYVWQGNSGSPVIDIYSEIVPLVIAIDSRDGEHCNQATTFNNLDLAEAIEEFPGPNTLYVDNGHPFASSGGGGSIFEPYETLQQVVNKDPAGGVVSMVAGIYPGAVTIDKAMTIQAPVGTVTIGGSGMFKIADKGYEKSVENKPAHFHLYGNYPNPFNPVTIISYDLHEQADVRLEIFDILGRRITTLVNETQRPGTHQVTWDASQAASGSYIYRITAGDVMQSRQMMVIK